jgi:hypothetical protein
MRWHFFRTSGESLTSRWLWAQEDNSHRILLTSEFSFANYSECMADALEHGYRSKLEHLRPPSMRVAD